MTKYLLPIIDVYCVRGVSLIKFTYFDSCLVDILSLIKKKKHFFVLVFHFDFPANLWFPNFIALDFSNGGFDFQNAMA